ELAEGSPKRGPRRARNADREPETRKTASGSYPGRSRIRLLMKETVRGPLGDSLLLGIDARIERGGRRRGCEHAAEAAEDRETGAIAPMALNVRPGGDARRAERLTEHGQARLRRRFRQCVLEREDHGTVSFRDERVACGRRSGRE